LLHIATSVVTNNYMVPVYYSLVSSVGLHMVAYNFTSLNVPTRSRTDN